MRTRIALALALAVLAPPVLPQERPAAEPAPPKSRPQWEPEEFGIGRKHTANARCNRAIDKLIAENLACYNARPAGECETLLKQNSKKMGVYIKSPRCAK
jgi:hypothetical protein